MESGGGVLDGKRPYIQHASSAMLPLLPSVRLRSGIVRCEFRVEELPARSKIPHEAFNIAAAVCSTLVPFIGTAHMDENQTLSDYFFGTPAHRKFR